MNAIPNAGSAQRLAELAARARAELDMLSFATKPWVAPRFEDGRKLLDVLVIGAGQSGLAVGHALKRRGVTNIQLIDRNPRGYEGVWETYARNHEIRSPKDITGMDLGFPSLSIRAFYEAKHGSGSWDLIARVPRLDWMDYLRWYRDIADLPIRNEIEVADIDFDADGVTVTTREGEVIRSRLLVLATGMDGGGAWHIPEIVSAHLPRERYHHTGEIVPREVLTGRRLGVLGAGAAAFDIAVTALTAGATRVDMFMRRNSLPMIDAAREMEHGGGLDHGHELSDLTKWEISKFMGGLSQSPAEHHFFKAFGFDNFALHLGSPWNAVRMEGDEIVVATPKGEHRFDHVFTAAGVEIDMAKRPELSRIAAKAAFWRDRFTPPEPDPSPRRLNFPYLGDCYQFTERETGTAPGIGRIYAFNALANMSMGGMSAVSISSHKFGVPRLAGGIAGVLFKEQEEEILPMLQNFKTPGIAIPPAIRARIGLPLDG